MEKHQNTSCNCQAETGSSDMASPSHCNTEAYACDKFKDPRWLKINIDYFPAGFEARSGRFENISPSTASQMLAENCDAYQILDVKTPEEFSRICLPGSLNLDFFSPTFKDDLFAMDKEVRYVVICKIGMRSEIAMNLMKKMGFREVYNVAGGDDRWDAEEIPRTKFRVEPRVEPCRAAACCS